jgi:hypothetical protein
MFTVEHNFDNSLIVVLDEAGEHEDLAVCFYDDIVFIGQWCDILDDYNVIAVSPKMFESVAKAYFNPEGAYK